LASNAFCPVAAYAVQDRVLCVQPHPEFDAEYAAFLLQSRREVLGDAVVDSRLAGLSQGHDGTLIARQMLSFVRGAAA
jgi:GMP synthase-like glutamine amidotransferase